MREERVFKFISKLILFIFSALCVLPLCLVIAISFSTESDIFLYGYSFIPRNFTLEAYSMVFQNISQIAASYSVTAAVTVLGTLLSLFLTSTLAYVICRKDYPLAALTSFLVFFSMLISGGLVAWYILVAKWLSLQNTLWALILPNAVIPWNVLLMKSFFAGMPTSLIDAAKIDGASETRTFFRIVLPVNTPGVAAVGLLIALNYWNDYFSSLMFIEDNRYISLQYLLYRIQANIQLLSSSMAQELGLNAQDIPSLTARMAICIIAAGPMLVIFPFFQKYFSKGITVGAVKG